MTPVPDNLPTHLLAVNIPIYKRPELLRLCLLKTVAAARDFDVAINLFDDSLDGTNDEVVAELKTLYRHVNHVKNPRNLGIDRNIDQAARFGDTEYVWLLGEDDYLLAGSISRVLPLLVQAKYALVAVNYGFMKNDLSGFSKKSVMRLTQDGELTSADLLARLGWSMGFIGACIVRRDVMPRASAEPYFGTYFAHLGCKFVGAFGQQCVVVSDVLVANRAEDVTSTSWGRDALRVYSGLERLLRMLAPPYDSETISLAIANAKPALPHRSVRGLSAMRAHGVLTAENVSDIDFTGHSWLRVYARLLVVFPQIIFASMMKVRRWLQD
jgi:glycosyltransferase involved in cell wall biosynthesis